MSTSRHTHRHGRKPVTGSVRRPGGFDARRRKRFSLGAGLFLFGLLCMIAVGLLGGPASPDHGPEALALLILASLAGAVGLGLILWGLVAVE